jgi:hypothetical protein
MLTTIITITCSHKKKSQIFSQTKHRCSNVTQTKITFQLRSYRSSLGACFRDALTHTHTYTRINLDMVVNYQTFKELINDRGPGQPAERAQHNHIQL